MAQRAGSADLPLHGGRVPKWLGDRMTRLGAVITEAIVLEYGRDELLRRLARPLWFQSFGAVMGMDWHSSGVTTNVISALNRGLATLSGELDIHVCGGRDCNTDLPAAFGANRRFSRPGVASNSSKQLMPTGQTLTCSTALTSAAGSKGDYRDGGLQPSFHPAGLPTCRLTVARHPRDPNDSPRCGSAYVTKISDPEIGLPPAVANGVSLRSVTGPSFLGDAQQTRACTPIRPSPSRRFIVLGAVSPVTIGESSARVGEGRSARLRSTSQRKDIVAKRGRTR
jgi:Protein of unknown function (DUF763)